MSKIRINENTLHNIIKKCIKEAYESPLDLPWNSDEYWNQNYDEDEDLGMPDEEEAYDLLGNNSQNDFEDGELAMSAMDDDEWNLGRGDEFSDWSSLKGDYTVDNEEGNDPMKAGVFESKGKIRLKESQLRDIIKNTILESINEVSPELKGASMVQADKRIRQLKQMLANGQKYFNKNGRTVDVQYEIERLERQKGTFGNGLMHDVNNAVNHSKNDETVDNLKRQLSYYREEMQNALPSDAAWYRGKIKEVQAQIKRLMNSTGGLRVYGDGADNGYSIDMDGDMNRGGKGFGASSFLDPSYDDGGLIRYDDPRDANKAQKLRGITDRLTAYSDSIDPSYMDDKIKQAEKQKQYGADFRKYNADMDEYERSKYNSEKEMSAYNNMNPLKKMFTKKPKAFNMQKPVAPDGNGVGHYFQDFNDPKYDGGLGKRQALRNKYSKINGEQNK